MNRAARQKLSNLKALAEHPDTPYHERENALQRIREIEDRFKSEKKAARTRNMPASMAAMANRVTRQGIAGFKRIRRHSVDVRDPGNVSSVREKWPFGWNGPRDSIDYESGWDDNGGLVLGWKCPACGDYVSAFINARHVSRLVGQSGGVDGFLKLRLSGRFNQLCEKCWIEWNDK